MGLFRKKDNRRTFVIPDGYEYTIERLARHYTCSRDEICLRAFVGGIQQLEDGMLCAAPAPAPAAVAPAPVAPALVAPAPAPAAPQQEEGRLPLTAAATQQRHDKGWTLIPDNHIRIYTSPQMEQIRIAPWRAFKTLLDNERYIYWHIKEDDANTMRLCFFRDKKRGMRRCDVRYNLYNRGGILRLLDWLGEDYETFTTRDYPVVVERGKEAIALRIIRQTNNNNNNNH